MTRIRIASLIRITPEARGRRAACIAAAAALLAIPAPAQDKPDADATRAAAGRHNTLTDDDQKAGWTLLFNGKDLTGWQVIGNKDAFTVDDEGNLACLGQNGEWIATQDEYRDFVLRLDYKVAPGGNSGVFLRATKEGNPAFTGMEVQILDDHGKEPDTHSTGSLYDEVKPSKNMSKPAGEWNAYEIHCLGNELRVKLNGEQLYAVNLDTTPDSHNKQPKLSMRAASGHVGLQDHGSPVWFRNVKLRKLDPSKYPGNTAGWIALFDGKSLDGWTPKGGGKWTVENGVLTGVGGRGYIHTHESFRDIELRCKARVNRGGNSGVFFRAAHPEGDRPWPVGGEVQIDNNATDFPTGSIYGRRRAPEVFSRDEEWFDLYARVEGERWLVRVNGRIVLDARESQWMEPGFIAFQAHDENGRVEFRDIQVRPIGEPRAR